MPLAKLEPEENKALAECKAEIESLKKTAAETKAQIQQLKDEQAKLYRFRLSGERLAVYLVAASILGGLVGAAVLWVFLH